MFKVTDYAALSTPTYRKIMVMKRTTTKIIWARSRWAAIANPHAKVFDSPSTPKSHPWGMTPATEWKFCSICFLFVRTHTKFGIKIIEYDMVAEI